MIKSMTGFGTATAEGNGWRIEVVVRSVNHRYLNARIRSFNDHPQLLSRVEKLVKKRFSRGDISVWISVGRVTDASTTGRIDRALARSVFHELAELQQELGLEGPPSLDEVARAGGFQTTVAGDEEIWPPVKAALSEALEGADASRSKEGEQLLVEIRSQLDALNTRLELVRERIPSILKELRQRLQTRVEELALKLDPSRLETEYILLADRFDVQEELVRLQTHLERAEKVLSARKPIGKELDFLSQEILREINTLGSKARDTETSSIVVDMKLAVEQFREQVQNVE